MISIRHRLIILLLSVIIITGSVTVLLSYQDAQHEVGELFDAQLAQSARVLDALILHQINKPDITGFELKNIQSVIDHITVLGDVSKEKKERDDYERKIAFQIWSENSNTLVLRSASAPNTPLSVNSLKTNKPGYSNEDINGRPWRVFSVLTDDSRYFMQVGEQYEIRNELIEGISKQLIRTPVLSLPILALLIWIAISQGLSPLGRVTKEVSKRNKENFESIALDEIPNEVKPLISSINDLLSRLELAFKKEQRFTYDAAHELRTPLAALKTQAQVALAAQNNSEKEHALYKIIQGVDRASHLVNQMLVIARMEKISVNPEPINLNSFVDELLEQFKVAIGKKELTISFDNKKKRIIQSDIVGLTILINNLLDNAIRYSPDKGNIAIAIINNDKVELHIENISEHITTEDLARVFDRFYRVPGSGVEGCGLGLSISKQIAEMLKIKIMLENNEAADSIVAKLIWI